MNKTQAAEKLLYVAQVAEAMSVTPRHVRDLIRAGEIAVIRTGDDARGDRIEPAELRRFMNKRRTNRSIFEAPECPSISAGPSGGPSLPSTAEALDNLLGRQKRKTRRNTSAISEPILKKTRKRQGSVVH
jgi:excisionase family DNA binding protein